MKKCVNKNCISKGELLPNDMFGVRLSRPDNLSDECKHCTRGRAAKQHKKRKENKEMFKQMFL